MNWFDKSEASKERNLAQPFIQRAIAAGTPGTKVIGALQRAKVWYDARQFGDDWRHWNNAYTQGAKLAFVNRDARPGEDLYVESRGLRASKYQTLVQIRGIDLETGDEFLQDVTVLHTHDIDGIEMYDQQQLYKRQELEDLAERYLDWYGLRESIEVTSIMPIMGYVNPDM